MKTFSVTVLISSLNGPAKSAHVRVRADNADDAKKRARIKVQKKHPHGRVTIGQVRE